MAIDKHIAAFSHAMGFGNPEIVFALATVPWENKEDRNKFIGELIKLNDGQLLGSVK